MTHFPHMMFFMSTISEENTMYDFEDVNRILEELAEQGIVEPMVEPIDEDTVHPLDWASVVGVDIFDEVYPDAEEMIDEHGEAWLVR